MALAFCLSFSYVDGVVQYLLLISESSTQLPTPLPASRLSLSLFWTCLKMKSTLNKPFFSTVQDISFRNFKSFFVSQCLLLKTISGATTFGGLPLLTNLAYLCLSPLHSPPLRPACENLPSFLRLLYNLKGAEEEIDLKSEDGVGDESIPEKEKAAFDLNSLNDQHADLASKIVTNSSTAEPPLEADALPNVSQVGSREALHALAEELQRRKCEREGDDETASLEESREVWGKLRAVTGSLSQRLCEQLRLVLEPMVATKLQGDYRSGKRINMRRVIPYIASGFRKDKIWLRRTKPAKRDYQVCFPNSMSVLSRH